MTLANLLRRDRPRPRPASFARVRRSKFDTYVDGIERQRDRALRETRAVRDWVAAYLERVADGHDADARYLEAPQKPDADIKPGPLGVKGHRAVADALRDIARDFERGPEL